ncbi:MAG: thioredoxin family protein [Deltaproteobacteria bacterium]|nr:thioredoxin family protein [Deltaproteobacteria bacterium]
MDWVDAPAEGDVANQVRREWARAKTDGRSLLVYVGAKWCEPCRYFHEAVQARRFDGVADGLRLLAYDLDRDKERLEAAGYGSDMIPLLAGTAPDGRGTARKFQGAVKGAEAVDYITPRLQRLLASQRRFDARVGTAEDSLRHAMDRGQADGVLPAGTATPAAWP